VSARPEKEGNGTAAELRFLRHTLATLAYLADRLAEGVSGEYGSSADWAEHISSWLHEELTAIESVYYQPGRGGAGRSEGGSAIRRVGPVDR
jgi:hypothetical protein